MARDPNTTALVADYDALVAQITGLRDEMAKMASQVGASASQRGSAVAENLNQGMNDARAYAGRKTHEADLRIEHAVAANPYLALGIAAGLGLLLGAVTRR